MSSTASATQQGRPRPHDPDRDAGGPAEEAEERELDHVRSVLHGYIDDAARAAPAADRLWQAVHRATDGGKMIRPRLVLTAHRALGGTDPSGAARAAAGFELLHTAFLIHDDVIDHDWERRGRPNVAGTFRDAAIARGRGRAAASHLGSSAALIAGDLAVAGAVQLVSSAATEPTTRTRLSSIVAGAVSATAAGELMDVELAASPAPDLAAVLAMYEAKTSVYTFCAPLQAGAELAGADPSVVAALGDAGRALGVAYQIADDLLGLFGDPAVTGKSVVSDAREGKQTVLAVLMAERGLRLDRVGAHGERALTSRRVAAERSGARAAAVGLADDAASAAEAALRAVPDPLRTALAPLLSGLVDRVA